MRPIHDSDTVCTCSARGGLCEYHTNLIHRFSPPELQEWSDNWQDLGMPGDPLCDVCDGTGTAWGPLAPDPDTGLPDHPLIPCPECHPDQLEGQRLGDILQRVIDELEELNALVLILEKRFNRQNR